MSGANINRIVLLGNLTKDPELRALPSGTSVCRMRVACSTRRRNADTAEWEEKPNYFDVTVFGPQAEASGAFLEKGRPVAVDGRLEWHEWEAADGQRRQAVGIIADSVQFLGGQRATREAAEEPAAAEKDDEALVF